MNETVLVKNYENIPVNKSEILRYMGLHEASEDTESLLNECLNEAGSTLKYSVCFREYEIKKEQGVLDLGFCKTNSKDLAKNLKCAEKIILFAATIGIGIDRLILKYNRISPVKALMFDAIGSERIESLCDTFCDEISKKEKQNGRFVYPRFSAGYGDLPVTVQKETISALDCQRKIGVTLNESYLMSPSKSVTAIIGVGSAEFSVKSGCSTCNNKNCSIRRNV